MNILCIVYLVWFFGLSILGICVAPHGMELSWFRVLAAPILFLKDLGWSGGERSSPRGAQQRQCSVSNAQLKLKNPCSDAAFRDGLQQGLARKSWSWVGFRTESGLGAPGRQKPRPAKRRGAGRAR